MRMKGVRVAEGHPCQRELSLQESKGRQSTSSTRSTAAGSGDAQGRRWGKAHRVTCSGLVTAVTSHLAWFVVLLPKKGPKQIWQNINMYQRMYKIHRYLSIFSIFLCSVCLKYFIIKDIFLASKCTYEEKRKIENKCHNIGLR